MNHAEFLIFQKQKNNIPPSGGFKFRVLGCIDSVRKFGAGETKKKMVGKVYDWAKDTPTENGRIFLFCPNTSFTPSFYYSEVELVKDISNKLMIPIEPQKLDYKYEEYTEIFGK
jgi:hypothetical protein